jgi:hypothetical protein
MPARLAAVSAVVASLFATALPAASADLYEPPYYPSGDAYYDESPAYESRYDRHAGKDFGYPVPPETVYGGKRFAAPDAYYGKDVYYGNEAYDGGKGFAPPEPYGGKGFAPPADWSRYGSYRYDDACVPRRVARRRLRREGWRGFHDFEPRGGVVLVKARRRWSGRAFELAIDRCSGEIVGARPLRGGRDFAYRRYRY